MTITLNASVDTTYLMRRFERGGINQILDKRAVAGGKGNNVARVLATLGHPVIATGFVAGWSGQFIESALRDAGIDARFHRIPGESRTSLALIEQETGIVSEIREPGVAVSPDDAEQFLERLPSMLAGVEAVIISGSLPPGLPDDSYARIIRTLRGLPVRIVFDSSGPAFRLGLAEGPDLIKPNADEMTALMGGMPDRDAMIAFVEHQLIGPVLGPSAAVLLSLGEHGAALITKSSRLLASAPGIDAVSPVGAGDAMIAGFLDARSRSEDDGFALRQAVAFGTAAALQLTPGTVNLADVEWLREEVIIG